MEETKVSRKDIGIRLILAILFLIVFEILKLVVQVTVLFQFGYLLITRRYSSPLRTFSNRVATYAYQIIRYVTLNDNSRPFPFREFPEPMEEGETTVTFGFSESGQPGDACR